MVNQLGTFESISALFFSPESRSGLFPLKVSSVLFFSLFCPVLSTSHAIASTCIYSTIYAAAYAPGETLTTATSSESRTALTQDPYLDGTWRLNVSDSRTPDDGRTDGIRTFIPSSELVMSSDGMEITLVSKIPSRSRSRSGSEGMSVSTQILVADGEPHMRIANGDTVMTRTVWKDGRLVVTSERMIYMGLRRMVFEGMKEYCLSDDGNELIVEYEIRNPDGMTTRARLVYDRAPRR